MFIENKNIYTLDSKGELLITIMSSLAQEESRSISENVTWGQRKRFADGKVSLPYKQFLGYEKGEDGLPKIVEKEATVVRLIYKLFLEGKTPSEIAKHLTTSKIPTPAGKEVWQQSTVLSILKNEKYKGDAMLQKSFYGSKGWHSTSKYRRVIWQCNSKFKNDERCDTPHLYEDKIKQAFLESFNSFLKNKDEILQGYEAIIQALTDTSKLDKESDRLQNKMDIVTEILRKCVEENAHSALDQADYEERYKALAERYESIKRGLEGINEKRLERSAKQENIMAFIKELGQRDGLITEFDEELWNSTVEKVLVHSEDMITFVFKDGMEIEWII